MVLRSLAILLIIPCMAYAADNALDNDASYVNPLPPYSLDASDFSFEVSNKFDIRNIYFPPCAQHHPLVEGCQLNVCRAEVPFGYVYVKVKSMKDGKCKYMERVVGLEGIDCTFTMAELNTLHALFAKRFKKFMHTSIMMTQQDYEMLGRFFRNHCVTVGDYQNTRPVMLGKMEDAVLDPEFSEEALSQVNFGSPWHPSFEIPYKANVSNYRSIMFTPSEISVINILLNGRAGRSGNEGR